MEQQKLNQSKLERDLAAAGSPMPSEIDLNPSVEIPPDSALEKAMEIAGQVLDKPVIRKRLLKIYVRGLKPKKQAQEMKDQKAHEEMERVESLFEQLGLKTENFTFDDLAALASEVEDAPEDKVTEEEVSDSIPSWMKDNEPAADSNARPATPLPPVPRWQEEIEVIKPEEDYPIFSPDSRVPSAQPPVPEDEIIPTNQQPIFVPPANTQGSNKAPPLPAAANSRPRPTYTPPIPAPIANPKVIEAGTRKLKKVLTIATFLAFLAAFIVAVGLPGLLDENAKINATWDAMNRQKATETAIALGATREFAEMLTATMTGDPPDDDEDDDDTTPSPTIPVTLLPSSTSSAASSTPAQVGAGVTPTLLASTATMQSAPDTPPGSPTPVPSVDSSFEQVAKTPTEQGIIDNPSSTPTNTPSPTTVPSGTLVPTEGTTGAAQAEPSPIDLTATALAPMTLTAAVETATDSPPTFDPNIEIEVIGEKNTKTPIASPTPAPTLTSTAILTPKALDTNGLPILPSSQFSADYSVSGSSYKTLGIEALSLVFEEGKPDYDEMDRALTLAFPDYDFGWKGVFPIMQIYIGGGEVEKVLPEGTNFASPLRLSGVEYPPLQLNTLVFREATDVTALNLQRAVIQNWAHSADVNNFSQGYYASFGIDSLEKFIQADRNGGMRALRELKELILLQLTFGHHQDQESIDALYRSGNSFSINGKISFDAMETMMDLVNLINQLAPSDKPFQTINELLVMLYSPDGVNALNARLQASAGVTLFDLVGMNGPNIRIQEKQFALSTAPTVPAPLPSETPVAPSSTIDISPEASATLVASPATQVSPTAEPSPVVVNTVEPSATATATLTEAPTQPPTLVPPSITPAPTLVLPTEIPDELSTLPILTFDSAGVQAVLSTTGNNYAALNIPEVSQVLTPGTEEHSRMEEAYQFIFPGTTISFDEYIAKWNIYVGGNKVNAVLDSEHANASAPYSYYGTDPSGKITLTTNSLAFRNANDATVLNVQAEIAQFFARQADLYLYNSGFHAGIGLDTAEKFLQAENTGGMRALRELKESALLSIVYSRNSGNFNSTNISGNKIWVNGYEYDDPQRALFALNDNSHFVIRDGTVRPSDEDFLRMIYSPNGLKELNEKLMKSAGITLYDLIGLRGPNILVQEKLVNDLTIKGINSGGEIGNPATAEPSPTPGTAPALPSPVATLEPSAQPPVETAAFIPTVTLNPQRVSSASTALPSSTPAKPPTLEPIKMGSNIPPAGMSNLILSQNTTAQDYSMGGTYKNLNAVGINEVFTPGNTRYNKMQEAFNFVSPIIYRNTSYSDYLTGVNIYFGGSQINAILDARTSDATTPFSFAGVDAKGRTLLRVDSIAFRTKGWAADVYVMEELAQVWSLQADVTNYNSGRYDDFGLDTAEKLVNAQQSTGMRALNEIKQHALLELVHQGDGPPWTGFSNSGYEVEIDGQRYRTALEALSALNDFIGSGVNDQQFLRDLFDPDKLYELNLKAVKRYGHPLFLLIGMTKPNNAGFSITPMPVIPGGADMIPPTVSATTPAPPTETVAPPTATDVPATLEPPTLTPTDVPTETPTEEATQEPVTLEPPTLIPETATAEPPTLEPLTALPENPTETATQTITAPTQSATPEATVTLVEQLINSNAALTKEAELIQRATAAASTPTAVQTETPTQTAEPPTPAVTPTAAPVEVSTENWNSFILRPDDLNDEKSYAGSAAADTGSDNVKEVFRKGSDEYLHVFAAYKAIHPTATEKDFEDYMNNTRIFFAAGNANTLDENLTARGSVGTTPFMLTGKANRNIVETSLPGIAFYYTWVTKGLVMEELVQRMLLEVDLVNYNKGNYAMFGMDNPDKLVDAFQNGGLRAINEWKQHYLLDLIYAERGLGNWTGLTDSGYTLIIDGKSYSDPSDAADAIANMWETMMGVKLTGKELLSYLLTPEGSDVLNLAMYFKYGVTLYDMIGLYRTSGLIYKSPTVQSVMSKVQANASGDTGGADAAPPAPPTEPPVPLTLVPTLEPPTITPAPPTETETPTLTPTPTFTETPTVTATLTETPLPTFTPTLTAEPPTITPSPEPTTTLTPIPSEGLGAAPVVSQEQMNELLTMPIPTEAPKVGSDETKILATLNEWEAVPLPEPEDETKKYDRNIAINEQVRFLARNVPAQFFPAKARELIARLVQIHGPNILNFTKLGDSRVEHKYPFINPISEADLIAMGFTESQAKIIFAAANSSAKFATRGANLTSLQDATAMWNDTYKRSYTFQDLIDINGGDAEVKFKDLGSVMIWVGANDIQNLTSDEFKLHINVILDGLIAADKLPILVLAPMDLGEDFRDEVITQQSYLLRLAIEKGIPVLNGYSQDLIGDMDDHDGDPTNTIQPYQEMEGFHYSPDGNDDMNRGFMKLMTEIAKTLPAEAVASS